MMDILITVAFLANRSFFQTFKGVVTVNKLYSLSPDPLPFQKALRIDATFNSNKQ